MDSGSHDRVYRAQLATQLGKPKIVILFFIATLSITAFFIITLAFYILLNGDGI